MQVFCKILINPQGNLLDVAELFDLLTVDLDIAVPDDSAFLNCEGLGAYVVGDVVKLYLERSGNQVVFYNKSFALGSLYDRSDFRSVLQQVGVRLLLIFQAAHKSAAGARDFYG